jgi:hypothetical protein
MPHLSTPQDVTPIFTTCSCSASWSSDPAVLGCAGSRNASATARIVMSSNALIQRFFMTRLLVSALVDVLIDQQGQHCPHRGVREFTWIGVPSDCFHELADVFCLLSLS